MRTAARLERLYDDWNRKRDSGSTHCGTRYASARDAVGASDGVATDSSDLRARVLAAVDGGTPAQTVAARRRYWRAAQPFIDPERTVLLDETGASTRLTWLYGRALRDERVNGTVPFGRWKTTPRFKPGADSLSPGCAGTASRPQAG